MEVNFDQVKQLVGELTLETFALKLQLAERDALILTLQQQVIAANTAPQSPPGAQPGDTPPQP